jgi:anti-anti-sigma regulatory factor
VLKITNHHDPMRQGTSLIVEGRLAGPWVEELRTYCRHTFDNHDNQQRCMQIDLTGVTFIDADGKLLLTQLWQQGMELRASGCLTRCLVEEITMGGRTDSVERHGDGSLG